MSELSDQQQVRLEKLNNRKQKGYAYPNDVDVSGTCQSVRSNYEIEVSKEEKERTIFTLAGRIIALRKMGKAAFFSIQDSSGIIQAYIKKDDVSEESFEDYKTFDLGDIVEISGYLFVTKTGEPTIYSKSTRSLVKCLHPLPEKWHGLSDVETRYRQRYLDLIVNPEVRDVFVKRAKVISFVRRFFDNRGYVEVETPVLSGVASGASAKPFNTHHNSLALDMHMRIALELPLKRLVVGGIERVYELGRVFRNEGISTEHNPEFTMIEFYEAYSDFRKLMDLTEELISSLSLEVNGTYEVSHKGNLINFASPWSRLTMIESIHKFAEVSETIDLDTLEGVREAAKSLGADDIVEYQNHGKALYEVFDRFVEHKLIQPTFIYNFPVEVSPLARPNLSDTRYVDRFELFVNGMELANAFSELNDSEDQRNRMLEQVKAKQDGDEEAMALDEDFIRALEYGLPPTAGEGIGIDRLVMLMTGAESIRDVILFPTLRPA